MVLMVGFGIVGCNSNYSVQNKPITPISQQVEQANSESLNKTTVKSENEGKRNEQKELNKEIENHDQFVTPKIAVKGIYVSGHIAGSAKLDNLIQLLDETELNAMVIDVKNDSGQLTYDSNVSLAQEIGSDQKKLISNMATTLQQLKTKGIYTIARIVTFKDPLLAGKKPELAMKAKTGNIWRDPKGVSWVDPYHPIVQQYNIEIAKEAASLGFDEVQFDYVRFPDNGKKVDQQVNFPYSHGLSKSEAIQQFLRKANQEIQSVPISADVFGLTTSSSDDMGIGQDWNQITQAVDVISPMLYPSHYSKGNYGVKQPDVQPYTIIKRAINDALYKNNMALQHYDRAAIIRPWYQAFTATWIKPHISYGKVEIMEQIKAAKEQGIDQYLLWNPLCQYKMK